MSHHLLCRLDCFTGRFTGLDYWFAGGLLVCWLDCWFANLQCWFAGGLLVCRLDCLVCRLDYFVCRLDCYLAGGLLVAGGSCSQRRRAPQLRTIPLREYLRYPWLRN